MDKLAGEDSAPGIGFIISQTVAFPRSVRIFFLSTSMSLGHVPKFALKYKHTLNAGPIFGFLCLLSACCSFSKMFNSCKQSFMPNTEIYRCVNWIQDLIYQSNFIHISLRLRAKSQI